jgi:hypothetical protein
MAQLLICDMCYIGEFICEFQKYYYEIDPVEREPYQKLFFNKLPFKISEILKEKWESRHPDAYTDTLGGRIQFLNDSILEQCTQNRIKNQVKRLDKICCDKNNYELPTQYGCKKVYKQGYKKYPKYYKKNYKVYKPYRRRNFKFNKYKFKDYKNKYNNYDRSRLWRKNNYRKPYKKQNKPLKKKL